MSGGGRNLLGSELSPYLRQHEHNPVHWYPWGEEAIQRARAEDKLIFLSIGYSTCHWCHVMERESFENPAVAAVMNENFINIKVDREERPDVDKVYMTFVQASTGGGGWPLSIFLAPDLNPVYGGTYFPPVGNYGRPGFTQILEAVSSKWEDNKEDMKESGSEVIQIIDRKMGSGSMHPGPLPPPSIFQKFYAQLSKGYDEEYGGYSKAPKFPQPSNLLTMFKLHGWAGESEDRRRNELSMNLFTLDMMNKGGIHDHISKGFARYSTDQKWHVPHFEKMLYDQAQLAVVYSIAVQLTGSEVYTETVQDILGYVSRDLTHPLGGFFTAEDADSYPKEGSQEKKEGAFCIWQFDEVKELLKEPIQGTEYTIADLIVHKYNMKDGGNVNPRLDPHGELVDQNVLTCIPEKEPLLDKEMSDKYIEKGKQILYQERQKRPRPSLDDKILCSSNGLMITGFCRAAAALQTPEYTQAACKAGQFIIDHMFQEQENQLLRSVYGSKPELDQLRVPIPGFIDDYVFTIQAMIDLYEATFDTKWLDFALKLQGIQDDLFHDGEKGGYFATQQGDPHIVLRLKDDHDGAEPSSNSISAMNLLRLSKLLNNQLFKQQAEKIFKLFNVRLGQLPVTMPALVDAYLYYTQNTPLLVVNEGQTDFVDQLRAEFLPSLAIAALPVSVESSLNSNLLIKDLKVEVGLLLEPGKSPLIVHTVEQIKEIVNVKP